MAAAGLFVVLTTAVWLAGVPAFERHLYDTVTAAVPRAPIFRWITRLGSGTVLVPACVLLIVLLPRPFRRHWWVWVAVILVASGLEGLGKAVIGRPRPGTLGPGFPSGHTAAAAAFYTMACYLAGGVLKGRRAKRILYAVAGILIALVGLSRMALHAHWPLDVLGGAALGIAVLGGAAWWHETSCVNPTRRRASLRRDGA